jgi:DNA-binding response OmpR family regulator
VRNILIVDDDLDLQRIYSEKLGVNGFETKVATDSDQASQFLANDPPNLILLDIMIPGKMNGLEFLTKIKKDDHTKNIPVIVLTNLDNQKQDALKNGASDYFVKANLSLNDLVDKVKALAK